MELSPLANKLKEIQDLASLARTKRRELEAQVSKLTVERFFYLDLAEQRKKEIRELRKGIQQLPTIPVKDLGHVTINALRTGPGAKTLRDICEITGLGSKALSRCLQTLIKQGRVTRLIGEGRKRGATYEAVAPWLLKDPHPARLVGRKPKTSPDELERIYLAGTAKPWTADDFLVAIKQVTDCDYSRSRAFALLKKLNAKFALIGSGQTGENDDRITCLNDKTHLEPEVIRDVDAPTNVGDLAER